MYGANGPFPKKRKKSEKEKNKKLVILRLAVFFLFRWGNYCFSSKIVLERK